MIICLDYTHKKYPIAHPWGWAMECPLRVHIEGLVQERYNSSVWEVELHLSCTNPSMCSVIYKRAALVIVMQYPAIVGGVIRRFHVTLKICNLLMSQDGIILGKGWVNERWCYICNIISHWLTQTQNYPCKSSKVHIDDLVQNCSNSSVLAMELLQSCTKPLISHSLPIKVMYECISCEFKPWAMLYLACYAV